MQNEHTHCETKPQASPSDYWTEHIRKWQDSGLSKAEYCRQNQLTKHAFHYWFKKLQRVAQDQGSIVPLGLLVSNIAPSQPPLVLKMNQRFQIAIQGDFNPSVLQKLINTLESIS